jgi:hypothetical protein
MMRELGYMLRRCLHAGAVVVWALVLLAVQAILAVGTGAEEGGWLFGPRHLPEGAAWAGRAWAALEDIELVMALRLWPLVIASELSVAGTAALLLGAVWLLAHSAERWVELGRWSGRGFVSRPASGAGWQRG